MHQPELCYPTRAWSHRRAQVGLHETDALPSVCVLALTHRSARATFRTAPLVLHLSAAGQVRKLMRSNSLISSGFRCAEQKLHH